MRMIPSEKRQQELREETAREERIIVLRVDREWVVRIADRELEPYREQRRSGVALTAEQWDRWDEIEKARNIELNKIDLELLGLGAQI